MPRNAIGRSLLIAGFGLAAFWPRLFNLDDLPPHPLAPAFRKEAIQLFWLMHNHPVEGTFLRAAAMNLRLSNWREEAGNCDGGRSTWAELQDVTIDVTFIGPWGIPIGRETISCGGAAWSR